MTIEIRNIDTRRRHRGMTLIEMMVAMAISSVLILGSIQMYAQSRSNYRTVESVARMQENLRFSIDILDDDVRLAGYWGKSGAGMQFKGQTNVTITCQGKDVTSWVMQPEVPIAALQKESKLPADCRGSNARSNSDVLLIRHAKANQSVTADVGVVQIQSTGSLGEFFDDGNNPLDASLNGKIFDVAFSAYYISNESKYDASLPSLRRLHLVGNRIEDQEIIPGVENLQVRFGIKRSGGPEGTLYVDGDDIDPATDTIISARLWLLVRSERNEAGQGYVDHNGPYQIPGSTVEIGPTIDANDYPPTFRRMALTRTIVLRNLAD